MLLVELAVISLIWMGSGFRRYIYKWKWKGVEEREGGGIYGDYTMNALHWNDRMACSRYGCGILVEYQKVDYFKVT